MLIRLLSRRRVGARGEVGGVVGGGGIGLGGAGLWMVVEGGVAVVQYSRLATLLMEFPIGSLMIAPAIPHSLA